MTASLNNDNANAMSPLNSSSEPPVPGISIQKNEEEQGNSNAADTSSTISTALPTPSTKASSHTNVSEPISYTLPKCELPPMSELEPVEKFVINAIQSQHEENPNPAHVKGYRALADALRRPSDPVMLRNVLIALRTAGSGRALTLITGDPIKHAHLTHLIMRFLSTKPPKGFEDNLPEGVDAEFFLKVYEDCSMLDAQMHLILAMVSAKSINLIPALTAVWKMLAMFPSNPEPV